MAAAEYPNEEENMKKLTDPSPRLAAFGAVMVAVASVVGAVCRLTHEQSSESTVVGWVEHLNITAFSLMLIGLIPPAFLLARRVAGSVKPGAIAAVAAVLLAALATISNFRGEDPSFFGAIAVPTNLAIFGSFIAIAVMGRRRGFEPKWILVCLPLVQLAAIPLNQFGGGILVAAFWLAIAAWATRGEGRTGAPAAPVPAAA
jgi:hypothetical protein